MQASCRQGNHGRMRHVRLFGVAAVALAGLAAGCGGSSAPTVTTGAATTAATTAPAPATTTAAASTSPSPLQAEAAAAATGDIPDNQVFLRFANTGAGFSM